MHNHETLTAIGHLLAGAGSDKSRISMPAPWVHELFGNKLARCIKELAVISVIGNDLKPAEEKVPILVRLTEANGYIVHVGTARRILQDALGGKALEGLRQPDDPPKAPLPEPEDTEPESPPES